jgi:hypothetical protein
LWAAYGIYSARLNEGVIEDIWVSRTATGGIIIVSLGILYAGYNMFRKPEERTLT